MLFVCIRKGGGRMSRKDKDVILEGTHHKVIYNQDFVAMPFCVTEKQTGRRLASYGSERAARAAVRHYDNKFEDTRVR